MMASTSASYDWIERDTPEAYDLLIDLLDPEFDPKGIAQRLKTQLTDDAKGVLVEHGYVDKDYRSTFYNFYAKKGRQYRPDCGRLHFFDSAVSYDEARERSSGTRPPPGRPLLRLHRTKAHHRRHLGTILVLSGTCGWVRTEGPFSPFTTSTCLVADSRYGDSPRWLSILT